MREMDMRVYLEGPYGTSHNLAAFEHVLLVAGGSGVTAILPYVHALQTKQHVQVTVVWSVTHRDYAADVLARELAGVEVQLYITRPGMEKGTDGIAVLPGLSGTAGMQSGCEGEGKAKVLDSASSYTSSTSNSASSSRSPTSPDPASSPDAEIDALKQLEHEQQGVTIHKKRPDMATLVNDAVDELVGGDRLAILACGPGGMMDDLRKAVVDAYGRVPGDQLTYYEDSFGW
jgi:NAD(P)H-flavin reductase